MSVSEAWDLVKVKDISASGKYSLVGGPFGSNLVSRDYQPHGVPVIRGTNLSNQSSFSFKNFVFVSEDKANELKANNAYPGDLVFTQRGTLGQIGLIPKNSPYKRFVISQSQMKLTINEDKADSKFIYYYFCLPSTVEMIQNLALSSGIPHINLDILRKFKVTYPPLHIQRKIAAVLSAYDDLIENNNRRIALLEKMAEEIYREWFVRLRFPGHEEVSFHKGVPEVWEVSKLMDLDISIIDGDRGKNYPKKDEFADSGYCLFLNTGNIRDDKLDFSNTNFITEQKDSILRKGKLSKNDIILTTRGTVGSIAFYSKNVVYKNVRINSGMVILRVVQ